MHTENSYNNYVGTFNDYGVNNIQLANDLQKVSSLNSTILPYQKSAIGIMNMICFLLTPVFINFYFCSIKSFRSIF